MTSLTMLLSETALTGSTRECQQVTALSFQLGATKHVLRCLNLHQCRELHRLLGSKPSTCVLTLVKCACLCLQIYDEFDVL